MTPERNAASFTRQLRTGRISRVRFVIAGGALMAIKYLLDRIVSEGVFDRPWPIHNYLSGQQALLTLSAQPDERPYYVVMLLVALPFIAAGTVLTLQRLRSARLPLWLVVVFFVPVVKFPFFAMLAVARERDPEPDEFTGEESTPPGRLGVILPERIAQRFGVCVFITAAVGVVLTCFNVYALRVYGLGLFVGLPFCLAMMSGLLMGYGRRCTFGVCLLAGLASVVVVGAALLLMNLEGALCLLMAAPIWMFCAAMGAAMGFVIQRHAADEREMALIMITILLAVPALMGAEIASAPAAELFAVHTAIDVAAAPERVWSHVIRFLDLAPPEEWVFRAGVAYPIGAHIAGMGVGARRHCRFSTGDFVEPIEVWDAPRLLRFSVSESPAPMREWTLYGDAHPPHLHGFLMSRAGQFQLTPIGENRTRLEGTTWYQHHMWPQVYWKWWSDYLIHRIHSRVLDHVAALATADGVAP